MGRIVAIFGPPGAGKTTIARAVCEAFDWEYLSSGDVARMVDPEALDRGEMADRAKLAAGFTRALNRMLDHGFNVVVDGLPRDPSDVALLPDNTEYLLINVAPSIGIARQIARQRDSRDSYELAHKRQMEQVALMELDKRDGWPFRLADWQRSMQTSDKRPDYAIDLTLTYLRGERKTLS